MKVLDLLHDHIITGDQYVRQMQKMLDKLDKIIPLTSESFDALTLEHTGYLDGITGRFAKLQDLIGAKIFPICLILAGEEKQQQTAIDVYNTLEKIDLLPSAREWRQLRDLRNTLTHEYAINNPDILIKNLNNVLYHTKPLMLYWKDLCSKMEVLEKKYKALL